MRKLPLAFCLLPLLVSLQQPRDVRPEPKGTGVISGVVQVDDGEHKPLRRVTMTLGGDTLLTSRTAFTADDGRFTFSGLPAGTYTIEAYKATYARMQYGARKPSGAGSSIALADGQRVANVVMRLPRWATITGTIYDQNGEPAPGISVEAMQYTMRTGRRTLSSVYGQPSTTDDRGVYRLGGLDAGQYYVAAGPSPSRGPVDVQRLTTSDIDRVLQNLASGSPINVTYAQPHQGFAPVFFPGSPEVARAQAISVTLGEERSGVDVQLQLVPTARIDGTVIAPDGQAAPGTQVIATTVTDAFSLDLFSTGNLGNGTVDAQGRFSYPAVPPGRYAITARSAGTPASSTAPASGPLWAAADIVVSGADQTVNLALQPGMTVSGKVAFDGTTLQPPSTTAGLRIGMPAAVTGLGVTIAVPTAVVAADGTFALTGVSPGSYRLTASTPPTPQGWVARSAMVNGVDALDLPFVVRPGENIDAVVVQYTDRPTELSGTLQAANAAPTSDYFIVIFSTDRKYWGPGSRRSVVARPSNNGRYLVHNLPPGEYFLVVVTDVAQGEWFDPAFLERLAPSALRITLADGEKKIQDLRVGGAQ